MIPAAYLARLSLHSIGSIHEDEFVLDIANGKQVCFHLFLAFLFEVGFFCLLDSVVSFVAEVVKFADDYKMRNTKTTFFNFNTEGEEDTGRRLVEEGRLVVKG